MVYIIYRKGAWKVKRIGRKTILAGFSDYQFFKGGDPQYIKWQQFFGINGGYARKLVSDFGKLQRLGPDAKTHRSLPEDYNKLKSLFESLV